MRGVGLIIDDSGIRLDFDRAVEDFDARVQNGLVNMAQIKGSDPVFPDKGTSLFKDSVAVGAVSTNVMVHRANFAALDTLFFSREHEPSTEPSSLGAVGLDIQVLTPFRAELDAWFKSVDETKQAGLTAPINRTLQ